MKQHPTLAVKPPVLQGLLYDFWWDLEKLHSLNLPVQALPVLELLWHLDLPYWSHNDMPFQITPRQVMAAPVDYPYHHQRTQEADLKYPIIVRIVDKQVLIIDGVHRLLKAVLESRKEIECALFSDDLIPLIVHE